MSRRCRSFLLGAALALSLPGAVLGGPARDELLRFVPPDVGFCLVVQGLRDRLAEYHASPFFNKWGKALLGPDSDQRQQLEAFEKYVAKYVGLNSKDVRDDVLGDAFVFAYRPGPADRPGDEQGLFLVRARDGKKLSRLIDGINKLQKATGELEALTDKEYRGARYVARRETRQTTFYMLKGQVLLFTSQEALLKRALDCDRDLGPGAKAPQTRRLEELQLDQALVALTVDPRAWDGAVATRAVDEATRAVAAHWKAIDGLGLGLHLDRDVRLTLTVKARAERLPPAARRFLAAAARPSSLWAAFPDGALLAVSARIDAAALAEAAGEFLTPAGRKAVEGELERSLGAVLGKDVFKELLPALGPDWGLCVTAPPADGKQWAPNAVLAVRVARGDDDDPIDQALLSAVRTAAQVVVLGHNKKTPARPLTLRTKTADRVRVRFLSGEGVFPPGVAPAFALKSGHLVLASTPAEIHRLRPGGPAEPAADVPMVRVAVKQLRSYLAHRRGPIADFLAQAEGMTRAKALSRLDAVRAALEAIDRVELRQQVRGGVAAFTLTVTPAASLKK